MRKRGRPKVELAITDVERVELQRLTKRAHVNRSIAFRVLSDSYISPPATITSPHF